MHELFGDLIRSFNAMRLIEGNKDTAIARQVERVTKYGLSYGGRYEDRIGAAIARINDLTELQRAKNEFHSVQRQRDLDEAFCNNRLSVLSWATAQGVPEAAVIPLLMGQAQGFTDMVKLALQGQIALELQGGQNDHEYRMEKTRQYPVQIQAETEAEVQRIRLRGEQEVQNLKDKHEERRNRERQETDAKLHKRRVKRTSDIAIYERRAKHRETMEVADQIAEIRAKIENIEFDGSLSYTRRQHLLANENMYLEVKQAEYDRLLGRKPTP